MRVRVPPPALRVVTAWRSELDVVPGWFPRPLSWVTKRVSRRGCPAGASSEAVPVGDVHGLDEWSPDLELDLGVRVQWNGARTPVPRLSVDERGDGFLRVAHARCAQRLLPHVEEVAEREGALHRRLDVDDAVCEIGRASCRERAEVRGVTAALEHTRGPEGGR